MSFTDTISSINGITNVFIVSRYYEIICGSNLLIKPMADMLNSTVGLLLGSKVKRITQSQCNRDVSRVAVLIPAIKLFFQK